MPSTSTTATAAAYTPTLPSHPAANKKYQIVYFAPIAHQPHRRYTTSLVSAHDKLTPLSQAGISGYCPVGKLTIPQDYYLGGCHPKPWDLGVIYRAQQWMEAPLRKRKGWRFVAELSTPRTVSYMGGAVVAVVAVLMVRDRREGKEKCEEEDGEEDEQRLLPKGGEEEQERRKGNASGCSMVARFRARFDEMKRQYVGNLGRLMNAKDAMRGKSHHGESLSKVPEVVRRKIAEMEDRHRMPWVPDSFDGF